MPTPPDPVGPDQPEACEPAEGTASAGDAEEAASSRLEPYLRILRRAIRSFTGLFQAHVMVIQAEAESEAIRVASGLVLLFGTMVFVVVTALLTGVGIVALIQRVSGLPWLESIGLAMASTATLALTFAGVAWLRLRKPLLPKSRKLLKSTFDGFTRG